jgi:membrane-anchored protein YejM (alkaline phosphatase superfamily)
VLARYREVFASVEYNFGLTILNDTLNRIKHLLFIDRFQSIFKLVKTGQGLREIDQAGMRRLKELLVDVGAKQPVFAHMHLLGTHGPGFDSVSVGGTAYQNAIADFDGYIGEFFKFLEGRGILKNTLVIIYSDHDSKNSSVPKIPMLLYLPGGEFAGEHRSECQLLDVAPTVLQAAGLSVPSYMEGAALQRPPSQPLDIYIASDVEEVEVWDYKKPPFYQFGAASVISCGVITEVKFPSIKTTVNGAPQCTSAFVGEGAAVKLSEMVSNEKIG